MSKEDKIIKEHKRMAEKYKDMYEQQRMRTAILETRTKLLLKENKQFEERVYKAIINIDILQEIIYQQPTENKDNDFWLSDKLDGIKNILKGGKND